MAQLIYTFEDESEISPVAGATIDYAVDYTPVRGQYARIETITPIGITTEQVRDRYPNGKEFLALREFALNNIGIINEIQEIIWALRA